jgi:UDP-N-acetylglucosamine 2-epimerase (non-hydrolysing)
MIDSLLANLEEAARSDIRETLDVDAGEYGVVTLHRPSNVDSPASLVPLIDTLIDISTRLPLIFPVHPRTSAKIREFGLEDAIKSSRLRLIEPLGYLDFLRLYSGAKLVLTDSGGLQEETTFLGIPCLTLRENTERPITIEMGSNILVGTDPARIKEEVEKALASPDRKYPRPEFWDGKAARRICDELQKPAA